MMDIFAVGGAIRDELLGLPVKDWDYVVVGSTPEEMLAKNFVPVGRDFPVFLHPKTHAEYALARTERKSGNGYHGFVFHASPDVTLEEDLTRRDLTVNAIAKAADGRLIDPFNGRADIEARVLRHVGPSFVEDPVRILRVARFAARFPDFRIAEETMALMRQMVANGEANHLVPERVWQEFAKGLMEDNPSRMFIVLRECGALAVLLPELDRLYGIPQRADFHPEGDVWTHALMAVDVTASHHWSLPVRWTALMHDLGKALTPEDLIPGHVGHEQAGIEPGKHLCDRLKVPGDCRDLALLGIEFHGQMHKIDRGSGLPAEKIVQILTRTDAFRRPDRFDRLLEVCRADYEGRSGQWPTYETGIRWREALSSASSIDAGAIAATCNNQEEIANTINKARTAAVDGWLKTWWRVAK